MTVVDGWTLFAHPQFLDQIDRLISAVKGERAKASATPVKTANIKLLAALRKLVFETVPSDPTRAEYHGGGALGGAGIGFAQNSAASGFVCSRGTTRGRRSSSMRG